MESLDTLRNKIKTLKGLTKSLTTKIASIHDSTIAMNLHSTALDVLLAVVDIENDIQQMAQKNLQISKPVISETKQEIQKVKRKLPRWAKNPDQINAKILLKFLTLQQENQSSRVSESELKELYGNDYEFFRNFNQMKIIAPKNHAKVFEVKNGLIEIWEPAQDAVDRFKKEVEGFINSAK